MGFWGLAWVIHLACILDLAWVLALAKAWSWQRLGLFKGLVLLLDSRVLCNCLILDAFQSISAFVVVADRQ